MPTAAVPRPDRRGLPPGQVEIEGFPRFGTHLHRPAPPVPANPHLEITGAVTEPISLPVADLATMPRRALDADFHCVSGWTATGLHWEGVPFATVYRTLIEPALAPGTVISHFVFTGLDGHESALVPDDALAADVLIADRLDGEPLDRDHGAPARLFSPDQYGYMSTKHLCRIEVRTSPRRLGAAHPIAALGLRGPFVLRHPRARVWEEERHPFLPSRLLGPVYRRIIRNGIRVSADRGSGRRIADAEHHTQPWRIHELTRDFRLEDVWELPGAIQGDDFQRLVERVAALDLAESRAGSVRLLMAVRRRLGELLGLDRPESGIGSRVASLRDRLPDDLRDGPRGPEPTALPATPLYQTDDEYAVELANETVHGVLHLGRVPDGEGRFHLRLAVLVRPNGIVGTLYLAGIRPFRHRIVYPSLLRELAERSDAVG